MRTGYKIIGWIGFAAALSACQMPVAYTQHPDTFHLYGESYFTMNMPVDSTSGFAPDAVPLPLEKPQARQLIAQAETNEKAMDDFADAESLSGEELGEIRGAFSPEQANLNLLEGIAAHNSVLNSVTGGNVIQQGSFEGTSGLAVVIQNSGNNTVIQSATIINLNLNSNAP